MCGGALKVRVMTSSRSDERSTEVGFMVGDSLPSLVSLAGIGRLLAAELADELVQFIEARIPELAIALEPVVQLPEGFRPQLVEALLGNRLHVDQPGRFQRAQ